MDGENTGSKPYEQMDDLGGKLPLFLGWHPIFDHKHDKPRKLWSSSDIGDL